MAPHHNANFQRDPKVDIKVRFDCSLNVPSQIYTSTYIYFFVSVLDTMNLMAEHIQIDSDTG